MLRMKWISLSVVVIVCWVDFISGRDINNLEQKRSVLAEGDNLGRIAGDDVRRERRSVKRDDDDTYEVTTTTTTTQPTTSATTLLPTVPVTVPVVVAPTPAPSGPQPGAACSDPPDEVVACSSDCKAEIYCNSGTYTRIDCSPMYECLPQNNQCTTMAGVGACPAK